MAMQKPKGATENQAVIQRSPQWKTLSDEVWIPCRDLMEGLWSIEKKTRHLLQRQAEPDDAYARRVKASYFDDHYGPTLRGYAALLSKYTYEEAPESINSEDQESEEARIASDVDFHGNDFKVFMNNLNQSALGLGAALTIVDYQDKAQRPYLKRWDIDEVFGWQCIVENGRTYPKQFSCKYEVEEPDKESGEIKPVEYYLQYLHRPVRTQLWKMADGELQKVDGERIIKSASGKALEEIPLVWHDFSGNPVGDPPLPLLLSLARLNLNHYNSLSEFQTILGVINGPTPVRTWAPGSPPPEELPDLYLSVHSVLDMPAGSSVSFLEPSGRALGISYEVINGQLEGMQRLGQRMLAGGSVARTATEVVIDTAESESLMLDLARRCENTAEEIFKLWRQFTDPGYEYPNYAGTIRINTKEMLIPMSPAEAQAVESKFLNGLIDAKTAIKVFLRGGWLKEEDLSDQMQDLLSGKLKPMPAEAEEEPKGKGKEEPEEEDEGEDNGKMESDEGGEEGEESD